MIAVDLIIILFLVMGFFIGWKKGFITSIIELVASFIVFYLATLLKGPVSAILITHFPFIKFDGILSGVTSLNIVIYEGIAYFICVVVLYILVKIVLRLTGVVNKILNKVKLIALPNHILGGVIGIVKNFIFVFILLFLFSIIPKTNKYVYNSKLGSALIENTPLLSNATRNINNSINEIINTANIQSEKDIDGLSLEILLKYNMITVDSAKELNEAGKLNIDNFDEIIKNYEESKTE